MRWKPIVIALILLVVYSILMNYFETNETYKIEKEWFRLSADFHSNNNSCIEFLPSYIDYLNNLPNKNGVYLVLDLKRICPFKEAKITIYATNLSFSQIYIQDSTNTSTLTLNPYYNSSFIINLNYSSSPNDQFQKIILFIPITKDFFNYYRFSVEEPMSIDTFDFEFKDDLFKGYSVDESSFSLIEGKIKQEESIIYGKAKRYRFENTQSVFFRFSPKRKIVLLIQRVLDAIVLGIISVLIYEFFKSKNTSRTKRRRNAKK